MRLALFASLAAVFAGTAYAQFGIAEGGEIPVACVDTCNRLQDSLVPACGALLNSSNPLEGLPGNGKRQAPEQYTQCIGAICNTSNFGQLTECMNCLVANGDQSLNTQTANAVISQISSLCSVVGSSVSGTVTATPTATGPFTQVSITATGAGSASRSASGAASSSVSASARPGAATSVVDFGRNGVVVALWAVGAAIGAALV